MGEHLAPSSPHAIRTGSLMSCISGGEHAPPSSRAVPRTVCISAPPLWSLRRRGASPFTCGDGPEQLPLINAGHQGRLAPAWQHERRGMSLGHRARRSSCPPQLIGSKSRRPQTACRWGLPDRSAEDGIACGDTSTHQAQGQWQTVAVQSAAVWQQWEPTTGPRREHGRVQHRDGTPRQQFVASRQGAVSEPNHDAMSPGVDRVAS